jgi:hypothetical protein
MSEFPSLYEKTGDIKDINTMLVPRAALSIMRAVQVGEPITPLTDEQLSACFHDAWSNDYRLVDQRFLYQLLMAAHGIDLLPAPAIEPAEVKPAVVETWQSGNTFFRRMENGDVEFLQVDGGGVGGVGAMPNEALIRSGNGGDARGLQIRWIDDGAEPYKVKP